jgi:hypothetical protein
MRVLDISGTFFEADIADATFDVLRIETLIGAVTVANVTVANETVLATGKGNIVFESRRPVLARFVQPREHVCAQAAVAVSTTGSGSSSAGGVSAGNAGDAAACDPGFSFDTCPGVNLTAAAETGNGTRDCRRGCARGTVAVGDGLTLADAAVASAAVVTRARVEAVEGGVHVRHVPFGVGPEELAAPWHGFGGAKQINFTAPDYEVLADALHGETEYDMLNIFIKGPGAPEGIFLWGRRDIYLKIHPPVLNMVSAGLLNPIALDIHATMSPAFCPAVLWSPDIFVAAAIPGGARLRTAEAQQQQQQQQQQPHTHLAPPSQSSSPHSQKQQQQHQHQQQQQQRLAVLDETDIEAYASPDIFQRKVASWKLLKKVTDNPDDTRFALREGCIGNFVFSEDLQSGRVSKVLFTWIDDPTVIAVGAISVLMAFAAGIILALVIKKVYRTQVKNKRAELLVRLRSLKSQGYYALGGGYFVYHSPPDRTRWKRDFYIGDPFGRILALRSMRETPKSFTDVFRALNGQSYQTVRIQIEDESAVKRARRRRRERELASSQALTEWYRGLKLQRGLEAKAKLIRGDFNLAKKRAEVMKNVKRARMGVLDGSVTTMVGGSSSNKSGGGASRGLAALHGSLSGGAGVGGGAGAGGVSAVAGIVTQVTAAKAAKMRGDDEDEDAERARIEANNQRIKRETEAAETERREDTERKEQSKLEARARKAEMADEEKLVAYFVGPYMFMEIFVETLALALIPGLQASRDFDKDAIKTVKSLMRSVTRQGVVLALSKAFRISDANMRERAIEYVKASGREEIDTVNRLVREYRAKRGAGSYFGKLVGWIGREKASQVATVTAHILVLLTPPLLLIIFGFMLVATWTSSPITARCFTSSVTAAPIFLLGFLYYFLAYVKLLFFYLEKENGVRMRLRRAFHVYTGVLIALSVALVMLVVFWVLLGLLLNPERAAAPATAIGTMVAFVLMQYRRLKEIREELRKGIKDFIEDKFARYMKHIENIDDVIDRVITDFGFSLRNVVVMIFAASAALGAIFAFIFLGIAVFEGKGAAMALIQSTLTAVSGAAYSFLKGKEGGAVKDKIKVKVPGLLKDLLSSILEKGMDMMKSANSAAGAAGAAVAAVAGTGQLDIGQDIEVTATLYGAIKLVERQDAVTKALEFPILKVGSIVEKKDVKLKKFWRGKADTGVEGGLGTVRSSRNGGATGRSDM